MNKNLSLCKQTASDILQAAMHKSWLVLNFVNGKQFTMSKKVEGMRTLIEPADGVRVKQSHVPCHDSKS